MWVERKFGKQFAETFAEALSSVVDSGSLSMSRKIFGIDDRLEEESRYRFVHWGTRIGIEMEFALKLGDGLPCGPSRVHQRLRRIWISGRHALFERIDTDLQRAQRVDVLVVAG